MARSPAVGTAPGTVKSADRGAKWHGSLDADIIIANAPDPVFVSDLEGKILQANDAVSQLLGFRQLLPAIRTGGLRRATPSPDQ